MDKERIRREICRFTARSQRLLGRTDLWRTPLVGFCSAHDPLFNDLKRVVSSTHALPHDLLPSAQSVIVFFIPFGRPLAMSNRGGSTASREWAQLYIQTNRLIHELGGYMDGILRKAGFETAAPAATHNFDEVRLVSDWSHRHAAFIAGLGRLGVNNMLITSSGCCGRIGSIVTSLPLPADERPHEESCLHRLGSPCLRCVERCVGNALFPDRFDRNRCYAVCRQNEGLFRDLGKADVCGKCLVGLPCSWTDPAAALRRKRKGRETAP